MAARHNVDRFCFYPLLYVDAHTTKPKKPKTTHATQQAEELIREYLPKLNFKIPARSLVRIKRLILRDLVRGRHETAGTLGRAELYFPIFEYFLHKHEVPEEMKYIPFVESRLKIRSVSNMQAAGLWQFMSYTGKRYKLKVNGIIDERYDAIKSSEAAARLLKDLHTEFKDWLLVLAAYNCGEGRVKRAMRKAGSKNYWNVERFLPKETRNYIPAFIANVYVGSFHEKHDLQPKPHTFHFDSIIILKTQESFRLNDIAKVADMQLRSVRALNPSYLQSVVPASRRGNYLILPAANAIEVMKYLDKIGKKPVEEVQLKPGSPIAGIFDDLIESDLLHSNKSFIEVGSSLQT